MSSPRSIDTEEEIRELYAALDERDQHIANLEADKVVVLDLQEENERVTAEVENHREELIRSRDTISELQTQLKHLREDHVELVQSKQQLEEEASAHKSHVDSLRSQLTQHAKASEDIKRLRKDGNQQLQSLELENQRLRGTIHEIEENEEILVSEIDALVQEKSEYQESANILSAKCDSLYQKIDEQTRVQTELLNEKNKLDLEISAYSKSEAVWKKRDADCRLEIAKLKEELESERRKNHNEEYEAGRMELAKLKHEHHRLLASYQQCIKGKNQAEVDVDSAIHALNESKANVKEEVAFAVRKEREASAELKRQLKRAEDKEKSLIARCHDLEEQVSDIHNQLENSEQRNSKYEENHGLSEAVRHQKKLETDLRRRDYDIKHLNKKLSLEIEHRRVLSKAVELLKEKASLGADFEFDDEEMKIEAALLLEDNKYKCENAELMRQVDALEEERTKLLRQLRERAIEIGEKGTRFLGMDPQQIGLVLEFASNVKAGRADLPLNDKSKELLDQINKLKSERDVDRITIERLEREVFSLGEKNCTLSRCDERTTTCNSVDNVTVENDLPLSVNTCQKAHKVVLEDRVSASPVSEALLSTGNQVQDCHEQASNTVGDINNLTSEKNNNSSALPHQIEYLRNCLLMANKRHEKLLDIIAKSDRVIAKLSAERELLSASEDTTSSNKEAAKSTTRVETKSEVSCAILNNTSARDPDTSHVDDKTMIMMNRILYLEKWKTKAMGIIESQLKSLETTVGKTPYVIALSEIDNLRRDNILLVSRVTSAHASLLKYREIIKSVGCNVDANGTAADTQPRIANNARIEALSVENALLWDRLVAYEEREQCMKISMERAVSECSQIKSKFAGGMTVDEASKLRADNDALKQIADLSQSQAATLLSLKTAIPPEGNPSIGTDAQWNIIHPTTTSQVERCEKKLTEAQNQVLELQNTCKALVSLVQLVSINNSYRHSPINRVILRSDHYELLSDTFKMENDIASSTASKVSMLIDTVASLQNQLSQDEDALAQLAHEKELLETKLSCFESSDILSNKVDEHKHIVQLSEVKSELFDKKRKLRQTLDKQKILEAKINLLEKANSRLELENANTALLCINDQDSKAYSILGPLLSATLYGTNQADASVGVILKQFSLDISRYLEDLQSLYSKYSSVQVNRMREPKVLKQLACLNGILQGKNKTILELKQKVTELEKQESARPSRAAKRSHNDDSFSSFGTIPSVGDLMLTPQKRGLSELRLEEAFHLIAAKDRELNGLSQRLSDAEDTRQCLLKQLQDTTKQSDLLKTDITTLVSKLAEEESKVAECEKSLSVQKQMHEQAKANLEDTSHENEKLKARMGKLSKERKEIEDKVKTLEADLQRSKRVLSVTRQGRARSDSNLKVESEKCVSAHEQISKLNKELNDLKCKLNAATEEKIASGKKARLATSRLKSLTEKYDPEAYEKVKSELEKRVTVLNQTVSGLATQNSKLRADLTRIKKEREEWQHLNKRPATSIEQTKSRIKCNQCKTLGARITSLELSLQCEQKQGSDNRQMLEMYQQRSFTLEKALRNRNEEESKYSSPRPSPSSVNQLKDLEKRIVVISKENEDLKEKIRMLNIARDEDKQKRNSLEAENTRMASQLEAFDLDFFEEIEDLKYKYNEAVRQLREFSSNE